MSTLLSSLDVITFYRLFLFKYKAFLFVVLGFCSLFTVLLEVWSFRGKPLDSIGKRESHGQTVRVGRPGISLFIYLAI